MTGYLINDYISSINHEDISINYEDTLQDEYILNNSLRIYLQNIKEEIDNVYDKWDKYKKITNKYEFINTNIQLDRIKNNYCVCSYKSISRSYFKLIEILYNFNFNFDTKINSFHLAEGPGGFIEAMVNYRRNKNDKYYGITLMTKDNDVPKWNKIQDFLTKNKNINIVYGPKKDGNLYFLHNLEYFKQNYYNKFDFVTGDGGFDYSVDFNSQEKNSINLLFCEILYALIIQKVNGSFVLKIFDSFHNMTMQLLNILCYFYKEVHIYKPHTSREANSERYIVCKFMKNVNNRIDIINELCKNFDELKNKKITNIFSNPMNNYFLNKIEEINAIHGQQQIENILQTLNYIEDNLIQNKEKVDKMKLLNIKKCIQWCINYKQPYYAFLQDLKI